MNPNLNYNFFHPNNTHHSNLSTRNTHKEPIFYHNFIVSKKNVDGNLLFESYKMKQSKVDNIRKRLLFERKQKSVGMAKIVQIKKRHGATSQGKRQNKQPIITDKLTAKHIKTSQDLHFSIDLRQQLISQFDKHNNYTTPTNNISNDNNNLHAFGHTHINSRQPTFFSNQAQNEKQCKVQRCNIMIKYFNQSNTMRKKQQSIIKKHSISKLRRSLPLNKIVFKKTLQQFLPILQIKDCAEKINSKSILQFPECKSKAISILLNNSIIYSKSGQYKREIASLTKIITCITALYLCQKFTLSIENTQVKISRQAIALGGTAANLKYNDIITMQDLLYGMMLPSGNDAAFAIAEFFGRLLYKQSPEYQSKLQQYLKTQSTVSSHYYESERTANQSSFLFDQQKNSAERSKSLTQKNNFLNFITSFQAVNYFITQMNRICNKHFGLEKTYFTNCHGLSDPRNKSTSNQLLKICYHCMKNNQKFSEIVKTKYYEAKIYNKNSKMVRIEKWINSNLLLQQEGKQCYGIKTGITPNAGPCLATYFKHYNEQIEQYFEICIILLNSESKNDRFFEVELIANKVIQNLQILHNIISQDQYQSMKSNRSSNYLKINLLANKKSSLQLKSQQLKPFLYQQLRQ